MKRKWNKIIIIGELKEFANSLGKTPREIDFINQGNYGLFRAAKRYFGTYTQTLQVANLKPNLQFWSKDKILSEFQEVISELGYVPTYRDLVKLRRYDLLAAIRRHFGNKYNQVVQECGFQPNNIRWNKNEIKEKLNGLFKKYERTPTEREIREKNCDLLGAAIRHFGSLNKAIKASGLKTNCSFVEDDLWKYWEAFVIEVLKSLYGQVLVHPRLPNKTIPDAKVGSKIIEVKLNVAHEYIRKDIENYLPYTRKMEIWYLYGKPRVIHPRVKYIGPKEIEELLSSNKQKDLLSNLFLLKKG